MQNVKKAALYSFCFIVFKLVLDLIPFSNFKRLFEDGVWTGLAVIGLSYIVVFIVIVLYLTIRDARKKRLNA